MAKHYPRCVPGQLQTQIHEYVLQNKWKVAAEIVLEVFHPKTETIRMS